MNAKTFFTHFIVAYGSCFLVLQVLSIAARNDIDAGPWGFYGFPLIGIGYAILRSVTLRGRPSA